MIRFLTHKDIDKNRWDKCIQTSVNALAYALSGYLDCVSPRWNALVLGDYTAVMPLPHKKKFGLPYISHPLFCQQLGIFYQEGESILVDEFLKAIPYSFIKTDVSLNAGNNNKDIVNFNRPNYLLPICHTYEDNHGLFNSNTRRNIKKAEKLIPGSLRVIDIDRFLLLKKQNPVNKLNTHHFKTLEKLFHYLESEKLGEVLGVENEKGELLAAAMFIQYKKRITYLFSASSQEGKEKRAMFKVINEVIRKNLDQELTLDFEGSMIPGVATFFKGFGAQPEYYARLSRYFHFPAKS